MNEPAIDEEEAEPRFLLSTGPGNEPLQADAIAAVLDQLRPAGLLLRLGSAPSESPDVVGDLRKAAQTSGVAFFIEDDVDLASETGVDGVHLNDPTHVKTARERLRDDRILGVAAGLSRHDAMTSGEQGADYIAFGDDGAPLTDEIVDLVTWWRETTVLPCLAFASHAEDVARLAGIGTDFIGVASAIWDHADGPETAADLMRKAIEAR